MSRVPVIDACYMINNYYTQTTIQIWAVKVEGVSATISKNIYNLFMNLSK